METLVELLRQQAQATPDRIVFTFLADGEREVEHISYGALDRRARAIAASLQARGLAGTRALLLYPPEASLEFVAAFFGCLYADVVAVPMYPPDPARMERSIPRFRAVVADARASSCLTITPIHQLATAMFGMVAELALLSWTCTDAVLDQADAWIEPDSRASSVAFLQYSSGSTGTPKGVVLTHGNVLANQRLIRQAFGHEAHHPAVCWLPLYHDMGLIGNIIHPIFVGGSCVLMSPIAFLQKPLRWLRAISHYRVRTSGAPNFAYDLCARKVTAEEKRGLDLASWDLAFCGAEPIRADTLQRFSDAFAACGFKSSSFLPCYGLAESTLIVSGGHLGTGASIQVFDGPALETGQVKRLPAMASGGRALVSSGRPLADQELAVVDPASMTEVEVGRIGEVWVAGAHVARGYWGDETLTSAVLGARLPRSDAAFLRTGDLGFLHEGELFITSRIKDTLIVRGRNHAPEDLEHTIESTLRDALRPGCGAVFSVDDDIVCVWEAARGGSSPVLDETIASIRASVAAEHQLQLAAVVLIAGPIAKTSSGKIQRSRCRADYIEGKLEIRAAWHAATNSTPDAEIGGAPPVVVSTSTGRPAAAAGAGGAEENWLRHVLAAKLGCPAEDLRGDTVLATLALDSLGAVELTHELSTAFGATIAEAELLGGMTISGVITRIRGEAVVAATATGSDHQVRWVNCLTDPDREQLIGLLDRVSRVDNTVGFPGGVDRATASRLLHQLETDLSAGRVHLLLLERTGVVIGQAILAPNLSPNNAHVAWVYKAMIDPEARVGAAFFTGARALASRCIELGVQILAIDVRSDARALVLWKALGFTEFGRLPDYARIKGKTFEGIYLFADVATIGGHLDASFRVATGRE